MTRPARKVRTLAQAFSDPRVREHSDERRGGHNDGVWLWLAKPWWCPDTDLPTVHEWTVGDALASLNRCYEAPDRWEQYENN